MSEGVKITGLPDVDANNATGITNLDPSASIIVVQNNITQRTTVSAFLKLILGNTGTEETLPEILSPAEITALIESLTGTYGSQITALDGRVVTLEDLAAASNSVSTTDIDNWNAAFGWGNHAAVDYEVKSNKGIANGYPDLDASTKVPLVQLPTIPTSQLESGWNDGFVSAGEVFWETVDHINDVTDFDLNYDYRVQYEDPIDSHPITLYPWKAEATKLSFPDVFIVSDSKNGVREYATPDTVAYSVTNFQRRFAGNL